MAFLEGLLTTERVEWCCFQGRRIPVGEDSSSDMTSYSVFSTHDTSHEYQAFHLCSKIQASAMVGRNARWYAFMWFVSIESVSARTFLRYIKDCQSTQITWHVHLILIIASRNRIEWLSKRPVASNMDIRLRRNSTQDRYECNLARSNASRAKISLTFACARDDVFDWHAAGFLSATRQTAGSAYCGCRHSRVLVAQPHNSKPPDR
jgi:hypothetical protein